MIAIYLEEYFLMPGDEPWHRASKEHSVEGKSALLRNPVFNNAAPYASPAQNGGGVCDALGITFTGADLCTGNTALSQPGDAHAPGAKAQEERSYKSHLRLL
jgi:hypothetical protein